jgi:hypothetical protein
VKATPYRPKETSLHVTPACAGGKSQHEKVMKRIAGFLEVSASRVTGEPVIGFPYTKKTEGSSSKDNSFTAEKETVKSKLICSSNFLQSIGQSS